MNSKVIGQWEKHFSEAFKDSSDHFGSLKEAVNFSIENSDIQGITFLNSDRADSEDPFGTVTAEWTPPGTFFPLTNLSPTQREQFYAACNDQGRTVTIGNVS